MCIILVNQQLKFQLIATSIYSMNKFAGRFSYAPLFLSPELMNRNLTRADITRFVTDYTYNLNRFGKFLLYVVEHTKNDKLFEVGYEFLS